MVKTARINTVSFSYSNVAKNWLVCKPWDILTLTEWEGGQMYVDLATPESLIWGICDDKKVFPETNETTEQFRVNYTPIAWDNTYKMEVSWEWTPKVWYFYTMTADQKIDLSTESDSVGQFMVQDINDAYIEVRFVCNQWLFVPQYSDVRLESISETNPDSDPFDGMYTFTLSNGTEISGDFSALAWYLGDVTITGDLTVQKGISATEDITAGGDIKATWDVEWTDVTASGTVTGNAVESTTSVTAATATISGALQAGDATLEDITADSITTTGDATVGWKVMATWDVQTQADLKSGGELHVGTDATIGWNIAVTGTSTLTWDTTISWDQTVTWDVTIGWETNISWTLWVASPVHFSSSVDVDEDLNVDGAVHVGGSATIDHELTVNEELILWTNATAPQFILQAEKNAAGWVAALDSNGKVSNSVLPPLAIGQTFVVDSEANQLALTAQTGDICVRTDISKTYIKLNDNNPSTMADWQVFYTSWEVISVNGQTWAVVLDADDIDDTTTTNKFVTAAEKTTWNNKQNAIWYTPENQAYKDTVSLVDSSDHYPSSSLTKTLLLQKQDTIGYTPENISNKDTATLTDSTTKYPSSHVMHDQLATKQETLVSGTNIKTINHTSLLWSGNIDISVGINCYYETTTQWAASHTLWHTPLSSTAVLVFTDSWTALFPTTDYTLVNDTITFNSLWSTESAVIWFMSAE